MTEKQLSGSTIVLAASFLAAALLACGGGGGGSTALTPPPSFGNPTEPPPGEPPPGEPPPEGCEKESSYDSTFAGIQDVIFERHGCTQQVCHGSGAQGGLDLRTEVAYANLNGVPSTSSAHPRLTPGDEERSYLWLKLAAATLPEAGIQIGGSPMPNGLPPISEDELELLRTWIYAGAPETGTVIGTEELLDACLPEPEPLTIEPLAPPAPGEGVQLVMPEWLLPAGSEHEICFASYFDVSQGIPEEFRDPSGALFRFAGTELRQDPQSHHLILNYSTVSVDQLHDPSFGAWTCKGGERDGAACEPTDQASCGDGLCASEYRDGFACIGFGPSQGGRPSYQIGGAQQAQSSIAYAPGVFAQIPMSGVLYWNSHAFNLTTQDHRMRGRINYYFADQDHQTYPVRGIFDTSMIFSASAAPFTTQTLCHNFVLPRGARLFGLSSHTHKHGKHFTVELPDGSMIYESFVYNDPVSRDFEPPLAFDSPSAADRTLHYCSLYNNGVNEDGSPNPETVTRASRVPLSAQLTLGRCSPIACVNEGMIGEPCSGTADNASCDSAPGAGDGFCDACRITGGESTENEMFLLLGQYYIEGPQAPLDGPSGDVGVAASAAGRSASTEIVPPPVPDWSAMAGHAGG